MRDADWGVAMTYYHGLWENSDLASGRVAWQKANQLAQATRNTTPREKAYIEALGEIYREDDKDQHPRPSVRTKVRRAASKLSRRQRSSDLPRFVARHHRAQDR